MAQEKEIVAYKTWKCKFCPETSRNYIRLVRNSCSQRISYAEEDKRLMKRADCVGMVGRLPTPKGLVMFWDTGKLISPVQLAEMMALQHSAFSAKGDDKEKAMGKAFEMMNEIAHQVNVYPVGQAALADDGRILVTEPYYNEKE